MAPRFKKAATKMRAWKADSDWSDIMSDVSKLTPDVWHEYRGSDGTANSIRQGISQRKGALEKKSGVTVRLSVKKGILYVKVNKSGVTGGSTQHRFKQVTEEKVSEAGKHGNRQADRKGTPRRQAKRGLSGADKGNERKRVPSSGPSGDGAAEEVGG